MWLLNNLEMKTLFYIGFHSCILGISRGSENNAKDGDQEKEVSVAKNVLRKEKK
jgi:hypothetical protein